MLGAFITSGTNLHSQTPAKPAKDMAEAAKPKRDWFPFSGTVAAVDANAKTISLKKKEGERVLLTDAKTTLEQNGKAAKLADIKAGNYLHGKLAKSTSGAEVILDAKIEPQAPAKKPGGSTVAPAESAKTPAASTNAPAKKSKKPSA